jgi:hypothetical protein
VARAIAGRLLRRGETAAVFTLDPASSGLALSVAFPGLPVLSLRPVLDESVLHASLTRIPAITGDGKLAVAARLAEILAFEGLGNRFFKAFEQQLNALAEGLTGCRPTDRRNLALLQLNRVLYLKLVQTK